MSVKWNAKRGKYEVRWLEGGRQPSRLFERKRDADAFELEIKRRQQLGSLAPSVLQSRVTLAEFVTEDWWPRHAIPNLAVETRRRYLEVWGTHLLPRVGDYELRAFTPMLVEELRDQMVASGVPAPTVRKALMILQGILRRAVVRGLISSNAAQAVPKPKQLATRVPRPLAPAVIERIRAHMVQAWTSPARGAGRSNEDLRLWRHRNATMVSLLAYGGLRPSEDRGATSGDLHGRTLHVVASKTGRARRRSAGAARPGPGGVASVVRSSVRPKPDLPDRRWRRVATPRLAELAPARVSACRDRCRRHRRSAPVSAQGELRVAAAVGGPLACLRRGTGRTLDRHPRQTLRGRHSRA